MSQLSPAALLPPRPKLRAAPGASAQSVTQAVSFLRGGQWGCTGFTPLSKRGQLMEALVLATCLLTGSSEGDPS